MNSSRTTILLAIVLVLFVSVFHFKIVKPEKKSGPPVLHPFRESTNKQTSEKGYSAVKKDSARQKISINKATLQDIMQVSGFGEKLGQKVVKKREELGGRLTVEDILAIGGIGESKLASLKEEFIIPSSKKNDKQVASLSGVKEGLSVCPNCGKGMNVHNRKKHEEYIYCPHCLSYLPEVRKTEDR